MTAVVAALALGWALVVGVAASGAATRSTCRRPVATGPVPAASARAGGRAVAGRGAARSPAVALGAAVLRLAGRPERATGPAAARRTGWAALVAGGLLP
ncbi:MAG: hypothetical protein C0P77_015920, partial [Thermoanaerobacterales bacterium]